MGEKFSLLLPEDKEILEEIKENNHFSEAEINDIREQSERFIKRIMAVKEEKQADKDNTVTSVDQLGLDVQRECALYSDKLKVSVQSLSERSSDGETVADTLLELKSAIEKLDPAYIDFTKRKGIFKFFSPVKRYFEKYRSLEALIDSILKNLDRSKEILKRDNITLSHDQEDMYNLTKKLSSYILMGRYIDQRLEEEINTLDDENRRAFLQEEVQFPLRQRVIDLQQQQAVNQQGIFAIEVIKKNNRELIRGIDRAKMVTVNALKIAVIVSQALADQQLVLEKINALNTTTSNLISGTSKKMKEQGAEIQRQASSAMLDLDSLKEAFQDINEALNEIKVFRMKALPKMKESIDEFNKLIAEGQRKLEELYESEELNSPADK